MNILFTSTTPFHPLRGGVGRVTDILCRELIKRGHNVYYLHLTWYKDDRKQFSYPVPVTILPSEDITDEQNILFFHNFLRTNNINIIINQDGIFKTSQLFLNIPRDYNIRTFSVIHNDPLLQYNHLWNIIGLLRDSTNIEKLKRIARYLLYLKIKIELKKSLSKHYSFINKNTDYIVLLSSRYINSLSNLQIHFTKPIISIPNPNTYENITTIPPKRFEILYVGRLSKEKAVLKLIKIWRNIYRKYPNWELTIVGDGPERNSIVSYTEQNHIDRITFTGFENPRPFYERASIFCMTSLYEGFPMTLTESMQFGCVPVAFNSFEAVNDIIIPKQNGELVPSYSVSKYIQTLENLISDDEYRHKLSMNAFSSVKKFDVNKIINIWEELLIKNGF